VKGLAEKGLAAEKVVGKGRAVRGDATATVTAKDRDAMNPGKAASAIGAIAAAKKEAVIFRAGPRVAIPIRPHESPAAAAAAGAVRVARAVGTLRIER
jgi:hypothetical protein